MPYVFSDHSPANLTSINHPVPLNALPSPFLSDSMCVLLMVTKHLRQHTTASGPDGISAAKLKG